MAKKVSPLRFCIDISDNKVSLIKTNKSGRIVKAATAELPEIPETINDAYTSAVTRAIKKAARKARIPKSFGMPCVMVTGGPNVVVRHFVWPDMTAEAFRSNLETEIAPYLPDDSGEYTIGYRISKRNDPNGSLSAAVDVLAAAVPLDLSNSYVKAAKKAGYKVQRIDLRENARNKLVGASPLTNKFSSYAILDISSRQINMAVYLEGVFYSNRYFAPIKNDVSNEQHDDDGLWQDAATDSVSALESATDMLVNEVSSIINYLQYRERGSNVECILLYGDENIMPHIMQSLAENLEMPVYKTEEWIKQSDKYEFMDAYGALLLPSGTSVYKKSDINLKAYKKPGAGRQMLVPAICMFIILCALNTVGIVIPRAEL
ncbi:MAG: pilus assembly protein PilM, partial [Defluviitaleaceae bacterium]|nr:pilus assembly protein PilM [Defluviitaleaceae bacterium]